MEVWGELQACALWLASLLALRPQAPSIGYGSWTLMAGSRRGVCICSQEIRAQQGKIQPYTRSFPVSYPCHRWHGRPWQGGSCESQGWLEWCSVRLHWVTSELLLTACDSTELIRKGLPETRKARTALVPGDGGLLQFPLPDLHLVSLGVGGQVSPMYLERYCRIPAPLGCMFLCASVFMRACSYTYVHKAFLHNTILMEMLFFPNESCCRGSEWCLCNFKHRVWVHRSSLTEGEREEVSYIYLPPIIIKTSLKQ